MHLTLSPQEQRDLKEALDRLTLELREELVHTDDRAYRRELRDWLERLERLDARLNGSEQRPSLEQPPV
jgi:hypothetical protein